MRRAGSAEARQAEGSLWAETLCQQENLHAKQLAVSTSPLLPSAVPRLSHVRPPEEGDRWGTGRQLSAAQGHSRGCEACTVSRGDPPAPGVFPAPRPSHSGPC